jgi:hypothetical protein
MILMDVQAIGRVLLIIGIVVAIFGGLLMLLGNTPILKNLGGLPGDIRIERPGFTCIFPLATMLLLSIVLTIVLNIIVRLINRP